ncbi:F-BAR and double SH3 domains protein 2-like isoform X4 [Apostichopus japonicus]|uniref:F-BAR and double SH3 domains protein 2-like isoform X4 n=1 Tax=Stichopus japonicus TaxID=307972 RepID=UPI003AB6B50C
MTEEQTVQQPPPRKVKLLHEVRSVRSEQLVKLHAKHQVETELLEDIKEFAKSRAAIEKNYAASLYKLSNQYLQKREFPGIPEEAQDDSSDCRTIHQVWKSLLEETSRVAQSRLAASEVVSGQVADSIKLQKTMRLQTLKKCDELCKAWDDEVQYSVRELARSKKNYSEAEKVAQEARMKHDEATQRLRKGSLKLFQSKNTLEKTCARLGAKRSVNDKRSAHLRNDYLFQIASSNAHQLRLFNTDLPYIMQALDGELHSRLRKYFMTFCTAEIEASTFTKMCAEKVLSNSEKINREFHHETFLKANPVFTNTLQYTYDPIPSDSVTSIIVDDTEGLYLEREARKWATEVAKMSKLSESINKQIMDYQSNTNPLQGSISSDSGFSQDKDPDINLDKLRDYLRKVETTNLKAEAKLEVLRNGGIEVDEWIQSAFDAIAKEAELEAQLHPPNNKSPEQEEDTNQTLNTTFDVTETINGTYDDLNSTVNDNVNMTRQAPLNCTSLYSYTAQRDDELTIEEGEILEIVEESEGDGWIKVQKSGGDSGYIPEAYVEVQRVRGFSMSDPLRDHQDTRVSSEYSQGSANSLTDYEVQAVTASMVAAPDSGTPAVCFVRALYDYTGSSSEELSFLEGTVFKVTSKGQLGVDDGYWEGELAGRTGAFPSLLVEEVDENGSVLGSEELSEPCEELVIPKVTITGIPSSDDVEMRNTNNSQDKDIEEEECPSPDFGPPDFAPPDFAPPPLPELCFTPGIPEEGESDVVTRRASYSGMEGLHGKIARPASFANFGTLATEYEYPDSYNTQQIRSAPQSPMSPSIKPVRSAPPPPSAKSARESWGQYGEEEITEEALV